MANPEQGMNDDIAFRLWRDSRVTPDAYSAWHAGIAYERERAANPNGGELPTETDLGASL